MHTWVQLCTHSELLGPIDAIYPPRVLDRRLQEDWARATKEGPGVLMNLRVDFGAHGPRLDPLFFINMIV